MIEDLILAPFRIVGSLSVVLLVLAAIVVLIFVFQRERNVYDWDHGCTCDRGPWGRTLRIDCPIHGRPRNNRRRHTPTRAD